MNINILLCTGYPPVYCTYVQWGVIDIPESFSVSDSVFSQLRAGLAPPGVEINDCYILMRNELWECKICDRIITQQ